MDPRLLKYYDRELRYIREMGGEFAREFPKIAGRLGLEGFECADPYVERLLEGFAFLAARVQLKIDAEFPRFTQHLLELIYPHYMAPTPSMAVVQFEPEMGEGALAAGFPLPRGGSLRTFLAKGEKTACEYRTAHAVTLWPIEIAEASYLTSAREIGRADIPAAQTAKAGLRLRLRAAAGLTFSKLALDCLPIYLRGAGELPMHLYEQLLGNTLAVLVRPARGQGGGWQEVLEGSQVRRVGFDDAQALLPPGARWFQGYRLLREYFAFPERFMFIEFAGLGPAVRRCTETDLDIVVLFNRSDPLLHNVVDPSNFGLFCAPAINLFPKRCDNIHLSERDTEYHVVPDRTAPMDFEIYDLTSVNGIGAGTTNEVAFLPFYARTNLPRQENLRAYYVLHRQPRLLSERQRESGPRSSYVGGEVFLSLVDAREAPFRSDLKQLVLNAHCTNRDLPLHLAVGQGRTDFNLQASAPVKAVRCVGGPTRPRPSAAEGETAWRLVSHLALNYESLADTDPQQGAAALRDLLRLYGGDSEAALQIQVDGVQSITTKPITRRLAVPGEMAFGRGMEVSVTLDEAAFSGSGVFLLGAILDQFFARYASLNSFTETVVRTPQRGEIMRWQARTGRRQAL